MVKSRKLRILELTNFSKGGDGVFARVIRESKLLQERGHDVMIFSSNRIKGDKSIAPKEETIDGIKIKRFSAIKLGGESFMHWNFAKAAIEFHPDIIIAHSYRHLHTTKALKVAKNVNAKVFLVTHAPFKRTDTRSNSGNLVVYLYDKLIGPKQLEKFDKVIAVSEWEKEHIIKINPRVKTVYVPNGISPIFFKGDNKKRKNTSIYMGRIAPIKDLETLIVAMSLNSSLPNLTIRGSAEKGYLEKLNNLINKLNLNSRVNIIPDKYDSNTQAKEMNKSSIFILPSKSEGMPQALVEAMASKMLVLASDIPANKDIVSSGKNGFLFKKGDSQDLADKLYKISSLSVKESSTIRNSARKSVEKFKWDSIINKIEELFN